MSNRISKGKGLFGALAVGSGGIVSNGPIVAGNLIKTVAVPLDGAGGDAGGGVGVFQNPETTTIWITRCIITDQEAGGHIGSGAGTFDIGTTAVSAATLSDNLIDGYDAGAAANTKDNLTSPGANGKGGQSLASGKWVTVSTASGNAAGFLGKMYISYMVVAGSIAPGVTLGTKRVSIPLAGPTDTAGGVGSWQNSEAGVIWITRAIVSDQGTSGHIASAACTLDIGTTAVSAVTLSDNLVDGYDAGAAANTVDNLTSPDTNGKGGQSLASGKWVTVSKASGASAGFVGSLMLEYLVLT